MKWRIMIAVIAVSAGLQAALLWVQDSGPIVDAQETIQTYIDLYLPDSLTITGFQFDVVLSSPIADYFEILPCEEYNILAEDLSMEMLDSLRARIIWAPFSGNTLNSPYPLDWSYQPFRLLTLTGGYAPNAETAIDTIFLENVIFSDAESQAIDVSTQHGLLFQNGIPYFETCGAQVPTKGESYLSCYFPEYDGISAFQFDLINIDHYPFQVDGVLSATDSVSWNVFDDTLRIIYELAGDDSYHPTLEIYFTDTSAHNIPDPYPLILTNLIAGDSSGNQLDVAYRHFAMIQGLSNNYGAVDGRSTPDEFILQPNYPNPFNPGTTISFVNPLNQKVSLTIYNILGEKVATLINKELPAGSYQMEWLAMNERGIPLQSGIYFTVIQTPNDVFRQKLIYLK